MKNIPSILLIFIAFAVGVLWVVQPPTQKPARAGFFEEGVYDLPAGGTPVAGVTPPAGGQSPSKDCDVGINCGQPYTLLCSDTSCGAVATSCVCKDVGTDQPPPGVSLTCSGNGGCGGGAPCPIGLSGYWTCQGGSCVSFCSKPGNNDGAPAATGDGTAPPPPQVAGAPCDPTLWANFSECTGSPAVKTRINQCGGFQSVYCTGNIQARAVLGVTGDSCATVQASATGLEGSTFQFTAGSASQPAPLTQAGSGYVAFTGIVGGTYTIVPDAGNFELARACWRKTLNAPLSGEGLTTTHAEPLDGDSLIWDVGYIPIAPWVEAEGGNVLVKGTVQSKVPSTSSPRAFVKDGSGGYPGLVTYGTDYDFDPGYLGLGENYVSSKNWLVNQVNTFPDYYTYFATKLGGPITVDSFPDLSAVEKPASRTKPYYVVGNMTTSGDWSVANGETIIFVVNGNLTINGKINTTGTGFIAFIVKGNITVSSNVGGLYTSSTPQIEGFYVTGPTGILSTGASAVVGKERLVLNGTFVASDFTLERDLTGITANTVSSELFTYDPSLLFRMPQALLDVPITWEEVAP